MNYLGHLYITRNHPELTYGNFIGDFIKGKKVELLKEKDGIGVLLHRRIDFFTDQHENTRKIKRFFSGEFGILSGILVDMYYDYVLATQWPKFCKDPLSQFTLSQLNLLDKRVEDMPERCAYMYSYFKKDNWLMRYESMEGLLKSLYGMTRQFNFRHDLSKSEATFLANEEEITQLFYSFIKDAERDLER